MLCPLILLVKVGCKQRRAFGNGEGKLTGNGLLEYWAREGDPACGVCLVFGRYCYNAGKVAFGLIFWSLCLKSCITATWILNTNSSFALGQRKTTDRLDDGSTFHTKSQRTECEKIMAVWCRNTKEKLQVRRRQNIRVSYSVLNVAVHTLNTIVCTVKCYRLLHSNPFMPGIEATQMITNAP